MNERTFLLTRCSVVLFSILLGAMQAEPIEAAEENEDSKHARGVVQHQPEVAPGYTLISPFSSKSSYLLSAKGEVVHQWDSRYRPGLAPYLLPNGNLLRGIQVDIPSRFGAGGISGGIQEFSWDGNLLWEFHLASDLHYHHHDIEPLPNGNILMIAWEAKSKQEALKAGRRPTHVGDDGLWPDVILEVEPLRPYGARVVWQWHVWDHLIQDTDPNLPNYGIVKENPHRVDINGDIPDEEENEKEKVISDKERARLIALGYLQAPADDADSNQDSDEKKSKAKKQEEKRNRERADWLHFNGIDYNAELDQIVVSSWHMNEIWIIDHSTTTEQAAGSTGGRAGRGGDLLYRWGNPQTYDMGTSDDRKLFHQHDPQWIPGGYRGAGNLLVFNNGRNRPGEEYSTVLEIVPPLQSNGNYSRATGGAFGPAKPRWEYGRDEEHRFYASFISGAHRLRNGNTLICAGPQGRLLEVSPDGKIVWEYRNPFGSVEGNGKPNEESTYSMFRATRISPDHPALNGKTLVPLETQPKTAAELFAERSEAGERASGWQSLGDDKIGASRWVNVNCRVGPTFRGQPDPDDNSKLVMLCTGTPRGFIRSDRMYENFILEFEWRLTQEQSESGLLIWADPLPEVGKPNPRGIEFPISNLPNSSKATAHGDIVPIGAATMVPDTRFRSSDSRSLPNDDDFHANPTDQWNRYRITAVDGTVTLEVNGHVVSAGSHCSPSKGFLCIESKGSEVLFRNPRIWELPAGTHAADASRTASEATEYDALYNGLDLDNWTIQEGDWSVEDWRFTCAERFGEIKIELPKDAKHLFFDFRRAEGPDAVSHWPLRLGNHRLEQSAKGGKDWSRVHVVLSESEVVVECGDTRHVVNRTDDKAATLVLVNDSGGIEFCNVFVRSE